MLKGFEMKCVSGGMGSLSFDGMVDLYDKTRSFDVSCFDSALDFVVERFPPGVFSRIFEPGIGTGRIAIPLAERGYSVVGVDISEGMLALLKRRLANSRGPLQISPILLFLKADATRLPFSDSVFDMAIAVHLFYFIQHWKKAADEILRVVRTEGPLILMHTGTGTEIPFLNDRYEELCAERGCPIETIGVKSTKEVMDYFMELGCHTELVRDRWKWLSYIQLDKAIDYISRRAYSFTTIAPDDIHSIVVDRLKSELHKKLGSLNVIVEVPNQIYLVLILRNGHGG